MTQQFDINKRLMALLKNEIHAQKELNALAKQRSKLESSLASKFKNQRLLRELDKITDLEQQKRQELKKRNALLDALLDQLAASRQSNAELLEEFAKIKANHHEMMANVHTLSEATNTFINNKELPNRLKGVSVSRNGDQWHPFDFDRDDIMGLITLWQQQQTRNTNADKWRLLLSSEISHPKPDKENNENVTAGSIIEIDLTSPQSKK